MKVVSGLAAICAALVFAGCFGGSDDGGNTKKAATYNGKPVTITLWTGFSGRELGVIKRVTEDFQKKNPKITVKVLGSVDDDKIIAAARGGNSPDVAHSFSTDNTGAFCSSGAWIPLQPYMDRDGVSASSFPESVQSYTKYKGNQCTLPMLADVYGLYYNKDLLAKAGITAPPKSVSELTTDAKKLTQRKSDGSIEVAGYVPTWAFYENQVAHYAPQFDAHVDRRARASPTLSTDPALDEDDQLVTRTWSIGTATTTWSASRRARATSTPPRTRSRRGKIAMMLDGEYRTAFIANEHPELNYGTAPMPVADDQPDLYGGGYITGSIIGIPKGAKNKGAAWELVKYLDHDDHALATLSNGLRNVPTTNDSLKSSELKPDPHFAPFLDIFANRAQRDQPDHGGGRGLPGGCGGVHRQVPGRQGRRPARRAGRAGQADRRLSWRRTPQRQAP